VSVLFLIRHADGEIRCQLHDSVRGKHVFIIQSCSTPVNDNIMEIILAISCARRCGADRITAVVPYFSYAYHKRGNALSTKTSSRFLWSVSADFAKMLEVMGVDRVIALDLQRPGQGQEACFFSNKIPVESVSTTEIMIDYIAKNVDFGKKVVIVAPNSEYIKKARKFQKGLREKVSTIEQIDLAAFLHTDNGTTSATSKRQDSTNSTFLGSTDVKDADVIIVDDVVETGATLSVLCKRLVSEGARRVFMVSSHGLFTANSMERIHASAVDQVFVTDSVKLPEVVSSKVVQVSVSKTLAQVIDTEFCSRILFRKQDEEEYEED
jgi:ribose-phosphate pyrophosphokinase